MKQKLLCTLLLAGIFFSAMGQQVSITGTVTDAKDGSPMPGVNVIIENTTQGTVTDIDGKYTLNIPDKNAVVVFSFLSYTTQKITVGEQSVLNIKLGEDITKLDEVVVIGYGTQKKTDKTGAVSHITSNELNTGVITDPVEAIQGKIAGVSVSKQGGDPTAAYAVTIRGAISIIGNTDPLYIIDGVPGADPSSIAPEDIESVNVLKDASSTAIYGARGSNGVIIMTTKSAQIKKGSVVEVNSYISIDNVAKRLDLMTASDWRSYAKNNNLTLTDNGANTDWQDAIFKTAFSQSNNFAISGANENASYRVSITDANFPGVINGNGKHRDIGSIDVKQTALDGKLNITGNISGTLDHFNYVSYGGNGPNDVLFQAYIRNPTDPIKNKDGSYFEFARDFNYWNPVAIINEIQNTEDFKKLLGNFRADLQILKGLKASVNLGYIRNDDETNYFTPTTLPGATPPGYAQRKYDNYYSELIESTISYDAKLFDHHNINIIAGHSFQQEGVDGFNASGHDATSNYLTSNNLADLSTVTAGSDIGSYKKEGKLISFFGRASYNYDSKYYLSASIRDDGSSKFGVNKQWGIFPAISGGWTLTEEEFLKNINFLNFLKLRLGYGVSGNQGIDYNLALRTASPTGSSVNPETGLASTLYTFNANNNPNLQWESTTEVNAGLDFGFLKNKISGSIELYDKTTDHLLYPYTVPQPPFSEPTQYGNAGKIANKGIEISVQAFVVEKKDFNWKTTFTFTANRQNVISLSGGIYQWTPQHVGWLSGRGLVGNDNWTQIVAPGYEVGTFLMPKYAGLNSDGQFLFYTADGGVTHNISLAQRQVVGHAMPRWIGGWSNYFTFYKYFDVNIVFRAVYGNDVLNVTKLVLGNPEYLNNMSDNLLKEALTEKQKGITSPPEVNSYYLEDGSFLRIDNITLGYNFGWAKSNWLKNLKVYITGSNLYTLTGYTGTDPESTYKGLSFGLDQYNTYPKTRSYTFGLNYKF